MRKLSQGRALAACHGYQVAAADGLVGEVDTPLFPPDITEPDYLIVRVGGRLRPRYPVVPTALVEEIAPERRLVLLRGMRNEIERLPENLPLVM
jgi:hypothetical protein